jgi:hypothetical protein
MPTSATTRAAGKSILTDGQATAIEDSLSNS